MLALPIYLNAVQSWPPPELASQQCRVTDGRRPVRGTGIPYQRFRETDPDGSGSIQGDGFGATAPVLGAAGFLALSRVSAPPGQGPRDRSTTGGAH